MIIYDFEVFKYDWLICWLDTTTKKIYSIVNNRDTFQKFYNHYKNEIWVGYNSRSFDQFIAKAILCDFDPYLVNDWIINQERKGHEFSNLFYNFPIYNYDTKYFFRSLKELEGFMGEDIQESPVDFNIDRKLTPSEITEVIKYCKHDVWETFRVFVETKKSFETIIDLLVEFNLDLSMINKTETQLAAEILGAEKRTRNDEFDIQMPDTLELNKYEWIKNYFYEWSTLSKNYNELKLKDVNLMGVPHTFGVGGLHGAVNNHTGEGIYIMADVDSYYPASMINYKYLSRNVARPDKYRQIRDKRIELKKLKDKKQEAYKLILNKTFGGAKDPYNKLYDPLQANNLCIANQLFIVDLLDKLEGKCELIQTNTDGILIKLFTSDDKSAIMKIFDEWQKRTGFTLGFDNIVRVIQKDVNNYIIIKENGEIKRKGAFIKNLHLLDNNLPIVNKALVEFFINGTEPKDTINNTNNLIDFQIITKVGSKKYEYAWHNGKILNEKVNRCFASKDLNDSTLMMKKKTKDTLDKVSGTPPHLFIINTNITDRNVCSNLDKDWYINLALQRINKFLGNGTILEDCEDWMNESF